MPSPDAAPDQETSDQMGRALLHAAHLMRAVPTGRPVWGRHGRSIGTAVRLADDGRAWLRVSRYRLRDVGGDAWNGTRSAAALIPSNVPRPHLLDSCSWTEDDQFHQRGHAYQGELTTYIASPVCSPTDLLAEHLSLPGSWWSSVAASMTAVDSVSTDRTVISQAYLDRAMPLYLQAPGLDTIPPKGWRTSHGDLHWGNLTREGPVLLDWEGWGLAPWGYDAALLAVTALNAPGMYTHARKRFSYVLETPEGRFAQLVVCTELLQRAEREGTQLLDELVRHHAAGLLAEAARR